jgi:hypothetical protein
MKMKRIYGLLVCISLFVTVNLHAQSLRSFFEALPDNCFVTPDASAAPSTVRLNILYNDELGFCGVSNVVVRITEQTHYGTIAMDATDSENKIAIVEDDFNILYTPHPGYKGQDSLKYTIECNGQVSAPALVLINIAETPDNMRLNACFITSEGVDWSIREIRSAEAIYCNYASPVVGDFDKNGIPDIMVVKNPTMLPGNRYAREIAVLEVNEAGVMVEKKVINTGGVFRWDIFDNRGLISTQINGKDTILFIQVMENYRVRAFNYDGVMVWQSNPLTMLDSSSRIKGILGFADFNQDGIPEVYYGREIIDTRNGHIICSIPDGGAAQVPIPSLAVDLYGTGKLNYIWGHRIYDFVDGPVPALQPKTAINNRIAEAIQDTIHHRFPIAVDMDGDGRLELALVTSTNSSTGRIYVIDPETGNLKAFSAEYNVEDYGTSYPFAGDIDGGGRPEIVIMTKTTINAYKYNGGNQLELLWEWGHDDHSATTGITLFDFNQDGKAELVYRDEQHLRIIDGSTNPPRNLATFENKSGTGSEYPVVADIDNDKQAEIISIGHQSAVGAVGQVRIYKSGSADFPWAPARKVWNQFSYNPLYVHDDLSIVSHPLNPATKFVDKEGNFVQPYNNILQQATLLSSEGKMLSYGADISVLKEDGTPSVVFNNVGNDLKVTVDLSNEGDNIFPGLINVSAYVWDKEKVLFLPVFSESLPLLDSETGAEIIPPLKVGDKAQVQFTLKDIVGKLLELEQVTDVVELRIDTLLQIRLNEKNNGFIIPECIYYNNFIGGANLYGTPPIVMCDGEERTISMRPKNGGYTYIWSDDSFRTIAKGPSITIQKTKKIQKYYVRVYDLDGNWINKEDDTKGPEGYYEVTVHSPAEKLIWTGGAGDSDWNDYRNWYNPSPQDTLPALHIPRACTDVLIPDTASFYPDLTGGVTTHDIYPDAACNEIRFEFGGELARPDSLHYSKAYIQYDFGYYDSKGVRLEGATSAKRDRWYALSAPLQKVVTGDFSFGGRPDTWQMGFRTDGDATTVAGHWEQPGNTNDIELRSLNHAIALRVAGNHPDSIGSDYWLGHQRGLNILNGVLEFPYFEGPNERSSGKEPHRIHKYANAESASYFSYYVSDIASQPLLPSPLGKINRGAEAYRFIFEGNTELINGRNVFKLSVPAGKYLMVGNPFMSTLDFNAFYDFNGSAKLENHFYLFDGVNGTFEPHNYSENDSIAALQAFFLRTKGSGDIDLYFPFEASVVRTSASHELRSSSILRSPSSFLRVSASHNGKISSAGLYLDGESGENIRKLFYEGSDAAPQIYFADEDENKNEIQYFGSGKTEISLGVRVEKGVSVNLLFSNLENLPGKSLYLVDKETGKKQNLLEENSYSFAGTSETFYNDRFVLEIGTGNPTLIEETKVRVYQMSGHLTVYSSQEIRDVELFDVQGRKIVHAFPAGNVFNIPVDGLRGVYIVKSVFSNGEVKVTKTIIR